MRQHYLVTGRVIWDDEDTTEVFEAESRGEAVDMFVTARQIERDDPDLALDPVSEVDTVYITNVFVSDTSINPA